MNDPAGRLPTADRRWSITTAFATVVAIGLFAGSVLASPAGTHDPVPEAFDVFLARYEAATPEARPGALDSFVETLRVHGEGFPIAAPSGEVVFVYRAEADTKEVRLVGDFLTKSPFNVYWDPSGELMTRLGRLFYRRQIFEPDARFDYQFVVDGERVNDPWNERTLFSGVGGGEVSELVMPGHQPVPEITDRPGVPEGRVAVVEQAWATPKVQVYLPPGYDPAARYPTLYTADGSAWAELLRLPTILDNLIADNAITPIIAVMIDAADDRRTWYDFDPAYIPYLERVVTHVDEHFATIPSAAGRAHAGTSSGGCISLHTGLERSDLIGGLGLLSPALDGPLHVYAPLLSGRRQPDPRLRVWIGAGTYEGSIHADAELLVGLFDQLGLDTQARFLHQGHSFGAWREMIPDMLRFLFAPP